MKLLTIACLLCFSIVSFAQPPTESPQWRITVLSTASSQSSAPNTAAQLVIPDGAVVSLSLNASIRSDEFQAGQQVALTVIEPVIINGFTVIERGTQARAHVERVDKAGAWARGGKIAWVMDDVLAVNGARVPLRFSNEVKGNNSTGVMVTGIAVTSFFFGPLGLLWGFKKGKQAVIPAGQIFQVFVRGDVVISRQTAQQQAQTPAVAKPAQRTVPKTCIFGGQEIPCSK